MIKRKIYSNDYKEKLVLEIVSGQSTSTQVSRRESVSSTSLNHWRKVLANDNFRQTNKSEIELRRRVGQLESAVSELALENAKQVLGDLRGCIHHTDSDVRYCSYEYTNLLKKYGMKISMCLGNVYENAQAESWNATVKKEEHPSALWKKSHRDAIFLIRARGGTSATTFTLKGTSTPSGHKGYEIDRQAVNERLLSSPLYPLGKASS